MRRPYAPSWCSLLRGAAQGGGHAAEDFARFGFEHLAAADPVVGTETEPGSEGFRAAEGALDLRAGAQFRSSKVPSTALPTPGTALRSTP